MLTNTQSITTLTAETPTTGQAHHVGSAQVSLCESTKGAMSCHLYCLAINTVTNHGLLAPDFIILQEWIPKVPGTGLKSTYQQAWRFSGRIAFTNAWIPRGSVLPTSYSAMSHWVFLGRDQSGSLSLSSFLLSFCLCVCLLDCLIDWLFGVFVVLSWGGGVRQCLYVSGS